LNFTGSHFKCGLRNDKGWQRKGEEQRGRAFEQQDVAGRNEDRGDDIIAERLDFEIEGKLAEEQVQDIAATMSAAVCWSDRSSGGSIPNWFRMVWPRTFW
jgi:hypothetical protein